MQQSITLQVSINRRIVPRHPSAAKKRVRIIKKVRIGGGIWKFISLDRIGRNSMDDLWAAAKVCRVANIMRP